MAHVRQPRPDSGLDFQVKSSRICYIYIMYTKIYYVSYIGYLDDGRDKLEDEVVRSEQLRPVVVHHVEEQSCREECVPVCE